MDSMVTLKQKIANQFWSASPPSLEDSERIAADDLEDFSHIVGKRWEEIQLSDVNDSVWVLSSMPRQFFAYYLGACMTRALADQRWIGAGAFLELLHKSQRRYGGKNNRPIKGFDFRTMLTGSQTEVFVEFLRLAKPYLCIDDQKACDAVILELS